MSWQGQGRFFKKHTFLVLYKTFFSEQLNFIISTYCLSIYLQSIRVYLRGLTFIFIPYMIRMTQLNQIYLTT